MRIAHVTATFPPYQGGTGNVCYYNARELARRGHDMHVFTSAMPAATSNEVIDGVRVHRLRPLIKIGNAPLLPSLVSVLDGFDIIHLHYPFIFGAELVRLASALHRTPLIVSFHNDLLGDGTRAKIFSIYQQISAKLTVHAASRLCAVSLDHYDSSSLSRALRAFPPAIVDLPNGVDVSTFSPTGPTINLHLKYGIPFRAKVVLFVAALDRAHHFKRLDQLLLAFRFLPEDVYLLVIGDGDLRPHYEEEAHRLGIEDRVVFVGAIPHKETPPFFRSAALTVLPSAPPESFGLVLIESLACGTPVVASNIPGVRTVVDHGRDGLLVGLDDPAALAEAIQAMLAEEAIRHTMGRRGRSKVETFYAWEKIGTRLDAIYSDLLNQSAHKAYVGRSS